MTTFPIVTMPDPVLKTVCSPVETVDQDVRKLLDKMLKTMYDAPGIGLAAPQIGITKRLVVVDCVAPTRNEEHEEEPTNPEPIMMINPEIIWSSDESAIYEEGCLSIPDFFAEIERPARIRLRYTDHDGTRIEREADGLLATCVQHEIDHLNGVLFIDYLSKFKRDRVIKKYTKIKKIESADNKLCQG